MIWPQDFRNHRINARREVDHCRDECNFMRWRVNCAHAELCRSVAKFYAPSGHLVQLANSAARRYC